MLSEICVMRVPEVPLPVWHIMYSVEAFTGSYIGGFSPFEVPAYVFVTVCHAWLDGSHYFLYVVYFLIGS